MRDYVNESVQVSGVGCQDKEARSREAGKLGAWRRMGRAGPGVMGLSYIDY